VIVFNNAQNYNHRNTLHYREAVKLEQAANYLFDRAEHNIYEIFPKSSEKRKRVELPDDELVLPDEAIKYSEKKSECNPSSQLNSPSFLISTDVPILNDTNYIVCKAGKENTIQVQDQGIQMDDFVAESCPAYYPLDTKIDCPDKKNVFTNIASKSGNLACNALVAEVDTQVELNTPAFNLGINLQISPDTQNKIKQCEHTAINQEDSIPYFHDIVS